MIKFFLNCMQAIIDLLGAVLFFISYYYYDVYIASLTLSVFASIKLLLAFCEIIVIKDMDKYASGLLIACGIATWYFHEPKYIQWKVSVIHALFALLFYSYHYLQGKAFFQTIMDQTYAIPPSIAKRADILMGHFMLSVAFCNYYIFTYFDELTWVYFKSSLFFVNLVYIFFICLYIGQHIHEIKPSENS